MSEFIPDMFAASSPEAKEALLCMNLIEDLHEQWRVAKSYQEDLRNAAVLHGQPLAAQNVVIHCAYENQNVPAPHDRIVFGPQYRKDPQEGISFVVMRMPDTSEDFYPAGDTNDIFLEVRDLEGNLQNYLLNSKGLVPYGTADDIAADDDFGFMSKDMFKVSRPASPKKPVSLASLDKILVKHEEKQVYAFHPQSNDDDTPFFFS